MSITCKRKREETLQKEELQLLDKSVSIYNYYI